MGVRQLLEAPLIEAGGVGREAFRLVTSDVRAMFDEFGNLKPLNEFGDDIARAVSSVKVTERVVKGADGLPTVERAKEFRL